jgi:hypothetical protein
MTKHLEKQDAAIEAPSIPGKARSGAQLCRLDYRMKEVAAVFVGYNEKFSGDSEGPTETPSDPINVFSW